MAWTKTFEGSELQPVYHVDALPASPTPVSDGERVFYFGNYGLVGTDLSGEVLWETRLPDPGYALGVGSSPILYEGVLLLSRDGAPEDAILALDLEDGSELWRVDRFEYGESHGTPFLCRNAERDELVVRGTVYLRSHTTMWAFGGE